MKTFVLGMARLYSLALICFNYIRVGEPFVDFFFLKISVLCQLVSKRPSSRMKRKSEENNSKFGTTHKAYGKHVLRLFECHNA